MSLTDRNFNDEFERQHTGESLPWYSNIWDLLEEINKLKRGVATFSNTTTKHSNQYKGYIQLNYLGIVMTENNTVIRACKHSIKYHGFKLVECFELENDNKGVTTIIFNIKK